MPVPSWDDRSVLFKTSCSSGGLEIAITLSLVSIDVGVPTWIRGVIVVPTSGTCSRLHWTNRFHPRITEVPLGAVEC